MAATDRSDLSLLVAVGRETSSAAAVATRIFGGLNWSFGPNYSIDSHSPSGFRVPTATTLNSQHTDGKVDGPFGFGEVPYLYAGLLGYSAPTTPASATNTRKQVYNLYGNAATPIVPQTYTLERGSSVRGDYCAGVTIHETGVTWDRKGGIKVSGAFFAGAYRDDTVRLLSTSGAPTGGSIAVVIGGQSATVPWNATSTQVKTLLEALSTVGSGNLAVSGGPLTTAPVRIQFADIASLSPVPAITVNAAGLTGGTSPSAAIARMSPTATMLDLVPAGPGQIDVYIADSYANLVGSPTKLLRAFSGGWKFSGMHAPVWTADSSQESFADRVESKGKTDWNLAVGADDVGMPLLRNARLGSTLFQRVVFTGPFIETAGGTPYYHQFVQDMATKITKVPSELKLNNNLLAVEYGGEFFQDATWGQAVRAEFTNTLATF